MSTPGADPRLVARAIRQRRLLRFAYAGHPREVEPHILGRLRGGGLAVSAYQVAGGSSSGGTGGWRTFVLGRMRGLRLLGRGFARARPRYDPRDPHLGRILVALPVSIPTRR